MLKEVREYYGIPQSFFADFLKVTRSHLSMAESGRRDLSYQVTSVLLPLYLAIYQPKAKQTDEKLNEEFTQQKQQLDKLIELKINENKYKLTLLEKKLSKMKDDQARSIIILESIPSIRAESKEKVLDLLQIIEHDARTLQKKTGLCAQFKLELQIRDRQAEMSFLNERNNNQ